MHKCWRSQEQACWPYMAGRENRRGEWMGLSVGNLSYRYLQISTFPQPKSVQKSFYMWSPSVTGHGLHRLGLNLTEFDLSGAARDDPPKTPTKSNDSWLIEWGQIQRGNFFDGLRLRKCTIGQISFDMSASMGGMLCVWGKVITSVGAWQLFWPREVASAGES